MHSTKNPTAVSPDHRFEHAELRRVAALGFVRAEIFELTGSRLSLVASWSATKAIDEAFELTPAYDLSEGLPGRVHQFGRPEWIEHAGTSKAFKRRQLAGRANVAAVAGVSLRVPRDGAEHECAVALLFDDAPMQPSASEWERVSRAVATFAEVAVEVPELPVRLQVCDDHPTTLDALARLFQRSRHIEVVATASNGSSAVELALAVRPDVIVMDARMPAVCGVEATRAICSKLPRTRIIGFTGIDLPEYADQMIRAGAALVLSKEVPAAPLRHAVVDAHLQRRRRPDIEPFLLASVDDGGLGRVPLTEREQEVVRCVAEGDSSKEIALELDISERTVDKHRENAMRKLGVRGTAGLTRWAIAAGVVAWPMRRAPG